MIWICLIIVLLIIWNIYNTFVDRKQKKIIKDLKADNDDLLNSLMEYQDNNSNNHDNDNTTEDTETVIINIE